MSIRTRSLISTAAGFCALGFLVIGLIYWAILASQPFSFQSFDWTLRIIAILMIVSIAVWLMALPETVGTVAGRRSTRLTLNAIVASLVAVAVGIVLNMVIANVPTARADWTAGQDFSISDQTVKVLQELDKRNINVTAVGLFTSSQDPQPATDLLKEYAARSSHFHYKFIDPDVDPVAAQQYGATRSGVVIFDTGKKRETANDVTEKDFTSALVRLLQDKAKTVAFLTGHGERDPNGSDRYAYSTAKQALTTNNYNVLSWSLITSPTLTVTDVDVLIMAQPMQPLAKTEVDKIQSYLDGGGHLFMLLDPLMPEQVISSVTPILQKYGVQVNAGLAVDPSKRPLGLGSGEFFVVDKYPTSDITAEISRNNYQTAFYIATSVQPMTTTVGTWSVNPIVQTSSGDLAPGQPASWLETDFKFGQQNPPTIEYNQGKDPQGPITVGVSVAPQDVSASGTTTSTTQPQTRLVVFGDADFPSDLLTGGLLSVGGQPLTIPINTDLFNNIVSWLAGANELVSISAKSPSAPRTVLLDAGQINTIMVSSVFALPLLVLIVGGVVWWRRR